ncbi:MAG: GGDEF domain-containing protein [Lachnospiraceae bacterium]|nr:GGDEF domain-containing protein [Lachnospiraceae bacterium]
MEFQKNSGIHKNLSEKQWTEWNHTIFRLFWKIWLIILLVEIFLFLFFEPTKQCSQLEYFYRFILKPSGLQAAILTVIQIVFTKFYKSHNRRVVSLYTIIIISAFAGITVCIHTSVKILSAMLILPMVLTPLYKDKFMTYIQAFLLVILFAVSNFYFIPMAENVLDGNPYSSLAEISVFIGGTIATYMVLERVNANIVLSEEISRHDSLTHLYNHEIFYEELDFRRLEYDKLQIPFSIIVADIDNFKSINDTYGHSFGDEVIRKLGQLFIKEEQKIGFSARYGGEEFAMIISSSNPLEIAENIRKNFEAIDFETPSGVKHFTISIGAAIYDTPHDNSSSFFEEADKALYVAKRAGKNNVVLYPNSK